jgi:hypothetical protein
MEIFFHKTLGNEKEIDLDSTPKGPFGGFWSPPDAYLFQL